ncbi:anti-repressor Ant [Vibrio phage D171]
MNIQTLSQSKTLTMSSREIAELTQKEHKNVTRTIESLISAQILTAQIEPLTFEHRGNDYKYYELNKRDSLVVVARLSPEFTAAVIDRWQHLEEIGKPKLPQTFADALQLAANQAKQLELQAPKVEYHDKVLATKNGMTTTEVAAELGMSAIKLNQKLNDMKVQRKISGRWVLRAAYVGKSYDVEQTFVDEEGNSRHSMKWSEKGRQLIHKLIGLQNDKS